MEKDKSPALGGAGGLPPHTIRYGGIPSPSSSFPMKPEPSESRGQFSHDIRRMPDYPPWSTGHRRAHSEILCLPDDISFDSDLGVIGGSSDGPSLSDETEEDLLSMYLDMDKFISSSSATSGMDLSGSEASSLAMSGAQVAVSSQADGSSEWPRFRHQHSQSMDGSTSIKPEMLGSGGEGSSLDEAKKAMSAAKLADLALIDPKRAKRKNVRKSMPVLKDVQQKYWEGYQERWHVSDTGKATKKVCSH